MKKILLPSFAFLFIFFTACNNADKKTEEHNGPAKETPKTAADSLMADVMAGHDASMAKYGKLEAMQKKALSLLDSIAGLPAKAREAAAPLKSKLAGVIEDLKSAKAAMDKWMDEFNMDSAENNIEQRIKYLAEEKLKVTKVKESILNGLQKADSLLKAKL
jgi:hypothetical protein